MCKAQCILNVMGAGSGKGSGGGGNKQGVLRDLQMEGADLKQTSTPGGPGDALLEAPLAEGPHKLFLDEASCPTVSIPPSSAPPVSSGSVPLTVS